MGQENGISDAQLATPQPSGSSLKRLRTPSSETIERPPPKKKAKRSAVFKTPESKPFYVKVPQLKRPSTQYRLISTQPRRSIPDIQSFLTSSTPLEIIPPALDLKVPRKFLSRAYGGNEHQFLQYFSEDMNPSGPFKRRLLTKQPFWDYLGEYNSVICGKMTPLQFSNQSTKVKRAWATSLVRRNAADLCSAMRARIALRKEGSIPLTPSDSDAEDDLVYEELEAFRKGRGNIVTEDDIISAFSRGDETMDIIRMTCVKYDHVFATDIEAKLPNFDMLLAASSQKKAASLMGHRHQRQPSPSTANSGWSPDIESEDDELEQEEEQDQQQEHDKQQESKQENEEESASGTADSTYTPPPPDSSPRRPPRVASQEVLRRIGEGLIRDYGVETSDSDYVQDTD
ncbi:hypothetical protein M413DRAFT_448847 [Hebeloma cylindrosporum]|uniref:DUF6697 domain-containing protein n=1 Tax=Hebeloma cylindrosporum TaxID=76867 RepID=A0A0C2XG86_HEBCY|nr:hypothetical protein M413DRAFT_448847 [Hebeloma cylindrosporum h7]